MNVASLLGYHAARRVGRSSGCKVLRSFWDAAQKEWPLTGQTRLPSLHDRPIERAASRPVGWDLRLR